MNKSEAQSKAIHSKMGKKMSLKKDLKQVASLERKLSKDKDWRNQ